MLLQRQRYKVMQWPRRRADAWLSNIMWNQIIMRIMSSRRLARHFAPRELHSRHLKTRLFIFSLAITAIFGGTCYGASELPGANNGVVDFKQWGLLAIQDGGRRKPVDTFAKEA